MTRTTAALITGVILIASVAVVSYAPPEALGPNLALNGSFELGDTLPDGWHWGVAGKARARVTLDDHVAHAGKRSVALHSDSGYGPNIYGGLSQRIYGITPGSRYLLTVWARGQGVGVCWFGGGPGWKARVRFPRGDFDWTRLELRWTAPADASFFDLRLNVDSATKALYLDDVSFREIDPITAKPRVTRLTPVEALQHGLLPLGQVSRPLRIDADLSDWPGSINAIKMPQQIGKVLIQGWHGPADLSATFRAAWDQAALYLAFQVTDDVHFVPVGAPAWTGDSIQFAVDPRCERTAGGYGPHDSEYSLSLDGGGKPLVRCWHPAAGLGDRSSKIRLAARRQGQVTIYEAAVPWSAIGVKLGPSGPLFGFSFLINDNDGSGRRGYLQLTPGIGRTKDPSSYLTAISVRDGGLVLQAPGGTIYAEQTVPLTATFYATAPLPPATQVKFDYQVAGHKSQPLNTAPLPRGAQGLFMIQSGAAPNRLPAGRVQVRATVWQAGRQVASATRQVVISDARKRVLAALKPLRRQLAATNALEQQVRKRGLDTDYERVALATTSMFIDFAGDDARAGRIARAQHVVAVLQQTLAQTTAKLQAYLSGRARPLVAPRFVTSRLAVKNGVFWADTVIPTTGVHQRRPVFFTGYGHFHRVVRDLPKFPALGVNLIQIEMGPWSTEPDEKTVTGQPVRDFIGHALDLGAKDNVMICWLASPHYFPQWALNKWPELKLGGGGFLHYTVDAPQARQIIKKHLEVSLAAIGDSPALHSVCLSNEPIYTNWQHDPFRLPLWHKYLRRVHGTIEKLNQVAGTAYHSFDEVPVPPTATLPPESQMTPLRYDAARFNMEQFAAFHRFMSDVVHSVRPGTLTHAKVMCVPGDRQHLAWGCDPEQFAYLGDLNGNDCTNTFRGFGNQYASSWIWQNMYYDLQFSARRVPVINSEDHIIADREQRLIPPEHTDCALWQGAIHGQGAAIIWVWERTYDRHSNFEGSILTRPENVMAVGRVGLDLMRLSEQVSRLQRARAPIAILYSLTSQIWSDRAVAALNRAYEALTFTGLPTHFVTERQAVAGLLDRYQAVVLPAVRYLPDAVAQAVQDYAARGGHLWVIGDGALGRDEYGRPRNVSLPPAALTLLPEAATPVQLRQAFLAAMAAQHIERPIVLRNQDGQAPWGVEYRSAPDDQGGYLLAVVNYWGLPQRVEVMVGGQPAQSLRDLRQAQDLPTPSILLQPLHAMLIRVSPGTP